MAFENFPSATGTPPPPPESPKTDWRFFLTIGLVIALLGTWGYIIWDKSKVKETIQQKDTMYASVSSEKESLKSQLDEATMRYDDLKTENVKKDSTITAKDREIAEKKARIASILKKADATKEELAEAKTLIKSLNDDISSYKQQVETLKGENLQLTKEKEQVTEERNLVQKGLDSAKNVVKQKESLIDVGSTLHASGFNIAGIDEKSGGKEKATDRAKKADKLRISFNLDENRIAASGQKDLYVCITGPDGNAIAVEALGSGTFSTREDGQKIFTQKVQVAYTQGQKQTVSFDWKQGTTFAVGNYQIEVYHNGFKIGEGTAVLKKGGLFG
jgi:aryl carrier-like protein